MLKYVLVTRSAGRSKKRLSVLRRSTRLKQTQWNGTINPTSGLPPKILLLIHWSLCMRAALFLQQENQVVITDHRPKILIPVTWSRISSQVTTRFHPTFTPCLLKNLLVQLKASSNFTWNNPLKQPVFSPHLRLLQAIQLHLSRFHSCCTGGHLKNGMVGSYYLSYWGGLFLNKGRNC